MSCVTSYVFTHPYGEEGNFGRSEKSVKVYGLNDRFSIESEDSNIYQGTVRVNMELDVQEAMILRDKLTEFLFQNS